MKTINTIRFGLISLLPSTWAFVAVAAAPEATSPTEQSAYGRAGLRIRAGALNFPCFGRFSACLRPVTHRTKRRNTRKTGEIQVRSPWLRGYLGFRVIKGRLELRKEQT
jgi:hypothetical protein